MRWLPALLALLAAPAAWGLMHTVEEIQADARAKGKAVPTELDIAEFQRRVAAAAEEPLNVRNARPNKPQTASMGAILNDPTARGYAWKDDDSKAQDERPTQHWLPTPDAMELAAVEADGGAGDVAEKKLDLSMERVLNVHQETLSLDYNIAGRDVTMEVSLTSDTHADVHEFCDGLGLHVAQCSVLLRDADAWQTSMKMALATEFALLRGQGKLRVKVGLSGGREFKGTYPLASSPEEMEEAIRTELCDAEGLAGDQCAPVVRQAQKWLNQTQQAVSELADAQMPATVGLFVPGYWEGLCPELHINADWGRAEWTRSGFVSEENQKRIRERWLMDGAFSTPIDWQMLTPLSDIAACQGRLAKGDWPPVLIFMYDEAWLLMSRLLMLSSRFMDLDVRPTGRFWSVFNRVGANSGRYGFGPHRDHPWELGQRPLDEEGFANTLTVAIPLTDMTVENSAEYFVRRTFDPYHYQKAEEYGHPHIYRRMSGVRPWMMSVVNKVRKVALLANETQAAAGVGEFPSMLQGVSTLTGKAGDVVGWDGEVLHWSSRPSILGSARPFEHGQLIIEFQRGDAPPMGPGGIRFQESPPFFDRLLRCMQMVKHHEGMGKEVLDGFEWSGKNIHLLINVVKVALEELDIDYDRVGVGGKFMTPEEKLAEAQAAFAAGREIDDEVPSLSHPLS